MDRRDDYTDWLGQSPQPGYGERVPREERRGYGAPDPLSAERYHGPVLGEPAERHATDGSEHYQGDPLRYDEPPRIPAPRGGESDQEALKERTGMVDAAAVRRSVAESDGLYRSRRPVYLALFSALAVFGELLMLRPLAAGMFGVAAAPALAPLLAMIAFPMLALGLYGLSTGAATAVQFQGPRVWLRTPLVYLPIGVALLIAAGTAAS